MTDVKHAFISYVKEDSEQVDKLCKVLDAAGIPYWRDRKDLAPGDVWKTSIRKAIRSGSLTFLACFSANSRSRDKSWMNEELTLAVEEFRQRPPGATWLLPVRFDEGEIPEWDLGAGQTLGDLNYTDLFGDSYAESSVSLITTINRVMGSHAPNAATTRAAVEEATTADRRVMIKQLAKEMVLDPGRRIELDDLINGEARRIIAAMNTDERFSSAALPDTHKEQVLAIVAQAQDYWDLVEPLCWAMQVAARWADRPVFNTFAKATKSIAAEAAKVESGMTALISLRQLPALCLTLTAAIAAREHGRWDNIRALAVDTKVVDRHGTALSLVEVLFPYAPFRDSDLVPNVLAKISLESVSPESAFDAITAQRGGRYFTPVEEWLLVQFKPLFDDQFAGNQEFEAAFNSGEVFLGLLAQDLSIQATASGSSFNPGWFGRATWVHRYGGNGPLDDYAAEFKDQGSNWAPLGAGLFGGDILRAQEAFDVYTANFEYVAKKARFS